ncbi:MAG: HAD-IA family hydrolase [Novosphingobium sp.]|nr:HAD-IA family hydrolase [Novosphingobium sp.]
MAASVKAVVFDVGQVLFRWDLRFLFAKLIADPAELEWFLSHVVTEEWHYVHDSGVDLGQRLAERKRLYPDHGWLIDAYANRYSETIAGPVEGMPEIVGKLASQGVALFAITNFCAEFWDQFRPCEPLFDPFRDIVVSGVERIVKPDPAIFELAARRFGLAPHDMLFVDDNEANVAAASGLGWQVHHFTCAQRLAEELLARRLIV